jgi:hypothetical protein
MSTVTSSAAASAQLARRGFLFKSQAETDGWTIQEYEFSCHKRGWLQRLVIYTPASADNPAALEPYAVLRTKCAPPTGSMTTVYDVEHVRCDGPQSVATLLDVAAQHLQQFEVAGAETFFQNVEWATPRYDVRQAVRIAAAMP